MKMFAVKLHQDQKYMEEPLRDLIKDADDESSIIDVFSDLFLVSVNALMINAPDEHRENIRKDLSTFIAGWRLNKNADH